MNYHEIKQKAEQFRLINLELILKLCGAHKDKYDKHKWHTAKGVLSVKEYKFFNWNQGIGGGGAIDLVIHLIGVDFKNAVLWLSEYFLLPILNIQDLCPLKEKPLCCL